MIYMLQQLLNERQKEKEAMLNDIQKLEYELLQLKNYHYELHGEVESLEHVIKLLNDDKELKQKLNALHGKKEK